MAVISTARGDALRNGLYATRSMTTPNNVHAATASRTPNIGGSPMELTVTNTT